MLRKIKSVFEKEIFQCLLSALLLILSFPKYNIEVFAWFGFVPLLFVLKNKSKLQAFFLAYLTGIIFWMGTIYWLVHVSLPGMFLLVLYLALYSGIFGFVISTINYQLSTTNLLFIPSLWVILEYIRSHLLTGFPWSLLGYSQYLNLPVIQIADITGVWGVSFLVMMVNVSIYRLCGYAGEPVCGLRIASKKIILPCLLLLLSLGYGFYKITRIHVNSHTAKPIKISVIQGNIPQDLKWDPQAKDFIINKYFGLTLLAAKHKPGLIIWPEAALPTIPQESPESFEKIRYFVKEIDTPLLLGAVTIKNDLYYNSALLVSKEGQLLKEYDKIHLVPFGEYIPLRRIFAFLEGFVPIGDFTRGREYTVFPLAFSPSPFPSSPWGEGRVRGNFSVLICFEDLFPELSREFVNKGADFLVNITNDAWFKDTSAPFQHLQASVFRAVENRVFLVRAANTGISCFIASSGKIVKIVQGNDAKNTFVDGYKTEEINLSKSRLSFYTHYGDIFVLLCSVFVIVFIINRKQESIFLL